MEVRRIDLIDLALTGCAAFHRLGDSLQADRLEHLRRLHPGVLIVIAHASYRRSVVMMLVHQGQTVVGCCACCRRRGG